MHAVAGVEGLAGALDGGDEVGLDELGVLFGEAEVEVAAGDVGVVGVDALFVEVEGVAGALVEAVALPGAGEGGAALGLLAEAEQVEAVRGLQVGVVGGAGDGFAEDRARSARRGASRRGRR
ncbi:hypothetical protein [Nannocystis sp.]|uniref:hypothetical protein n=1 Tax=Nannocystis sp. TaxID=1962667 RepID=UPI0025DA2459|nr:hypothetical protein [Nannocystis sp.]MBK7825368.1 hypothetical protein [Nannocystis sp.]